MPLLSTCIILITTVAILQRRFPKCMKQQSIVFGNAFNEWLKTKQQKKRKYEHFSLFLAFWPLGGSCKDYLARLKPMYRLNLQKIIEKELRIICIWVVSALFFLCTLFSMVLACLLSIILISTCFLCSVFSSVFSPVPSFFHFAHFDCFDVKHPNLSFPNHINK